MRFEQILVALHRHGEAVARFSWHPSGHRPSDPDDGMPFVAARPGFSSGVPADTATAQAVRVPEGTTVVVEPYLTMVTTDGDGVRHLRPWTPSTEDLHADDWFIRFPAAE